MTEIWMFSFFSYFGHFFRREFFFRKKKCFLPLKFDGAEKKLWHPLSRKRRVVSEARVLVVWDVASRSPFFLVNTSCQSEGVFDSSSSYAPHVLEAVFSAINDSDKWSRAPCPKKKPLLLLLRSWHKSLWCGGEKSGDVTRGFEVANFELREIEWGGRAADSLLCRCHTIEKSPRDPCGSPEDLPSLCSNSRGIHRGSAGDFL